MTYKVDNEQRAREAFARLFESKTNDDRPAQVPAQQAPCQSHRRVFKVKAVTK